MRRLFVTLLTKLDELALVRAEGEAQVQAALLADAAVTTACASQCAQDAAECAVQLACAHRKPPRLVIPYTTWITIGLLVLLVVICIVILGRLL